MYTVFSLWWLKPAISYLFIYLFPFYFLFFPTLKYTWLEEKYIIHKWFLQREFSCYSSLRSLSELSHKIIDLYLKQCIFLHLLREMWPLEINKLFCYRWDVRHQQAIASFKNKEPFITTIHILFSFFWNLGSLFTIICNCLYAENRYLTILFSPRPTPFISAV